VTVCASCGHENSDAARFCEACGAALGGVSSERRKVVTVLFCDVVGSTALGESTDPEALRALLARYFERMSGIVEHHGGSVEKFVGDAVMAVFGVPVVHEDDALRACRAAVEMRDAFAGLGIEGRIGVSTGEVVTGTEERLATGDVVNVAARLEQSAQPGAVLIGEPTLALVRDAAEVEPVEPLELKGKAEPVPAYRLLRVREATERGYDAQFVGRERELSLLREAWERVRSKQRCELVTIVGEAGVGKSRLVAEVLTPIDATTVRGRCLPYGDGITYWPVVEVLKQLELMPEEEAAAMVIGSLLGETEATTSAEEIAWAFRKTLEQAAAEQPLVVVFDDIQWGEEAFGDLIEHVALLSTARPVLLLCMARPELTESRPAWPVTLRLEPLGDEAVDKLIPERLPGDLREKVAHASGGNPLFIKEMLAMAGEAEGEVFVPPNLRALLAARLDQLEASERSVLERGAIEGEVFHRGAVQALAPEESQVTPRLASLVRKDLIKPDRPLLAGEDGFRFRHLLIRDAAYDALPKAARAELHGRFASWLGQHGAELVELDELLGYHLERACDYRDELGMPRDDELATTASRYLAAGGNRASLRQDYHAAASLFERAAALLPPTEIDLALETELDEALFWAGRGDEAVQRADALAERASAAGDRVGELCGRLLGSYFSPDLEPARAIEMGALVEEALRVFEAAGDDLALFIAYTVLSEVEWRRAKVDASLEANEQAFAHARRAGHQPPGILGNRAAGRFFGTTPLPELLTWLDENEPPAGRDLFLRAYRAGTLAMLGRFEEARTILAEDRALLAERGGGILLANITTGESVWVELWAGNPAAAAEFGAEGWRLYQELGDKTFLPHAAANLAQALYAFDRLDEAEAWADRAAEAAAGDDAWTEMRWRQVKAKVLARRGEFAEAERLALQAVAICDATEMLNAQGDVYADLGEVLVLAGKPEEAAAALEQALERYERKGNVVSAHRVQAQLAELREAASR
jgi:class 3 adenylate cyclase/tetratricopeptide (TPR) repeat protein